MSFIYKNNFTFFSRVFYEKNDKISEDKIRYFQKKTKKEPVLKPALKKHCSRICSRKRAVCNPVQIPEKRIYFILPGFHFFQEFVTAGYPAK